MTMERPIPERELTPEYVKKKPYLKKYYQRKKEKIIFQERLNEHVKRLLQKGEAIWVCLGCDTLTKFDNTLAARRHIQILQHTVFLKINGDRSVCLHKCGRCGVVSSCRKAERVHGETFDIAGPCNVCKCIEEAPTQ